MMAAQWSEVGPAGARPLLEAAQRLPLEQSWAYAQGMAASGAASIRYLALGDRAVAAVCERRWWGLWPVRECLRGPVWLAPPEDEALVAEAMAGFLRAAFRRHPFAMSFWTPDAGEAPRADALAREAGMRRVQTGHATSIVPVLPGGDSQRALLHAKWRNALVAAEARGRLRVRVTRERQAVAEIVGRYEAMRRARRFAGPAGATLASMAGLLAPKGIFAVVAERGASTEAGALFVVHGDEATWVAGFATAFGRGEGGHRRVLMAAFPELRRLGVARLDLGGIDTQQAPGIARFKLGLGGDVLVLPGTWGR